uniref:Uncharacterized protein n=1 Tax=Panagrolaimus sp. ES5 TaxID=591445 RepID=A0AC34G1F1_9BILA
MPESLVNCESIQQHPQLKTLSLTVFFSSDLAENQTTKFKEMRNVPQFQSGLILWIGSEIGWKAMRRFVECSLQQNCIAPSGATKLCNYKHIYKRPKMFSGCHRYDQSAINLILYETSNQKPHLYGKKSNLFKISRKRV